MKIKVTTFPAESNTPVAYVFDMNDPILLADFAESQDDYPCTLSALAEFMAYRSVDLNEFVGAYMVEVVTPTKYGYKNDHSIYCTSSCAGEFNSSARGTWIRIPDGDGFTCPTCHQKLGVK